MLRKRTLAGRYKWALKRNKATRKKEYNYSPCRTPFRIGWANFWGENTKQSVLILRMMSKQIMIVNNDGCFSNNACVAYNNSRSIPATWWLSKKKNSVCIEERNEKLFCGNHPAKTIILERRNRNVSVRPVLSSSIFSYHKEMRSIYPILFKTTTTFGSISDRRIVK